MNQCHRTHVNKIDYMHSLLDLSSTLLTGVLQEWLAVGCLLTLDSACCSTASRKAFLDVVQSSEFYLGTASTLQIAKTPCMNWLIGRRVKIKKVWMRGSLNINVGMVTAFLHVSAATLETFWISECTDAVLLAATLGLLSFSARKLNVLGLDKCDAVDGTVLGTLLSATAHSLQRLRLSNCTVSARLSVKRLPELELLQIYDCVTDVASLCQLIYSSPNLRAFSCNNLYGDDACLDALADHCPVLQELYYENGDPKSDASLVRLMQACPNIQVVDVRAEGVDGNPSATDSHITAIVQHGKKLKAFSTTAKDLSDATVMAVASHLDPLRHLWLYDCAFATDQPVLSLSKHCRHLQSLTLSARDSVASQSALVTLMSNLHCIVELRMQGFELTDPVLEAMAAHCPHLQVLNLYDCIGYTEVGIAALARRCAALRKVCARDEDEVLTPAAKLLWQMLRPGLRFSHRSETTSVWAEIYNITREKLVVL
jgi:hypothetical protein